MIEKPKRPKKIPNQDNKLPQTIQELIRRYDLDNTKVYDFLDDLVGHLKQTQTVVSPTEPTEYNREKVWIQKGKNLFDKKSIKSYSNNSALYNVTDNGIKIEATSNITYAAVRFVSINLEGLEGKDITISMNVKDNTSSNWDFYIGTCDSKGENRNILKRTGSTSNTRLVLSMTVPEIITNTNNYLLITMYVSGEAGCQIGNYVEYSNIQLEQGSTATEYEEYIESKIYVKNDNDVYEEFVKQEHKNAITVGISSDHTTSSTSSEKLKLNKTLKQVGHDLNLSDGYILIGKNINMIKVSAQINIEGGVSSGDRIMCLLKKKSGSSSINLAITQTVLAGQYQTFNFSEVLTDVVEGDIIAVHIHTITKAGAKVISTQSHTFVTVESI